VTFSLHSEYDVSKPERAQLGLNRVKAPMWPQG
jgi:hypothetical protein